MTARSSHIADPARHGLKQFTPRVFDAVLIGQCLFIAVVAPSLAIVLSFLSTGWFGGPNGIVLRSGEKIGTAEGALPFLLFLVLVGFLATRNSVITQSPHRLSLPEAGHILLLHSVAFSLMLAFITGWLSIVFFGLPRVVWGMVEFLHILVNDDETSGPSPALFIIVVMPFVIFGAAACYCASLWLFACVSLAPGGVLASTVGGWVGIMVGCDMRQERASLFVYAVATGLFVSGIIALNLLALDMPGGLDAGVTESRVSCAVLVVQGMLPLALAPCLILSLGFVRVAVRTGGAAAFVMSMLVGLGCSLIFTGTMIGGTYVLSWLMGGPLVDIGGMRSDFALTPQAYAWLYWLVIMPFFAAMVPWWWRLLRSARGECSVGHMAAILSLSVAMIALASLPLLKEHGDTHLPAPSMLPY